MRRFECLRDLSGDAERLIDRKLAMRNAPVQALAVHKLQNEKLLPIGLVQAVDLRDMRMVQSGEDLRFSTKPGQPFGIVGKGRRQNLQRHVASELRVLRFIYVAHAARTKR